MSPIEVHITLPDVDDHARRTDVVLRERTKKCSFSSRVANMRKAALGFGLLSMILGRYNNGERCNEAKQIKVLHVISKLCDMLAEDHFLYGILLGV
jgi:hypothetical protein